MPIAILPAAANEAYEDRLRAAFSTPPLDGVGAVAFGDLFLADLRRYREERLAEAGVRALFPLWGSDTHALARTCVAAGFRAVLVSVDGDRLDPEFVGRELDDALLDALPPGVDPCGENGEFHTFVYDGPIYDRPLAPAAVRTLRPMDPEHARELLARERSRIERTLAAARASRRDERSDA